MAGAASGGGGQPASQSSSVPWCPGRETSQASRDTARSVCTWRSPSPQPRPPARLVLGMTGWSGFREVNGLSDLVSKQQGLRGNHHL